MRTHTQNAFIPSEPKTDSLPMPAWLWATHCFSQHKEALSDPLVNRKPTSTISSVDVQSPAGTSWFYCLRLVILISSLEVNFTSIYDYRMRSHIFFFFVYFQHFFLNVLQTGKMSPKRVQRERWLSITGTNMSKLQLEIRNKQHQQKMTGKDLF